MWWRCTVLPSLPWVVCFLSFFYRLLKIAVWKIQRDGGATSALARAKDTPPVCRHRSHTGGTGWVTAKHESVPDRAPTRRSDVQTCGSDLLMYRADRARALSWQRNINVQERSSRTAAADGRLLRKVIGSNEGTGAQRIDRSRAPSARSLAVDSRWPPPCGASHQRGLRQKTPNLARVQEPYFPQARERGFQEGS